jgi:hypothetical protein
MSEIKKYRAHIVWALAVIVALGGGFFWGKSMAGSSRAGFPPGGVAGAFGSSARKFPGGATGGGMVTGQIAAMDGSSITLQLPNGNSQIIFYSSSTQVSEPTMVPVSTLKEGTNVVVAGTSNSDGSMAATTIQVRTGTGGGFGGGAAPSAGK